MVPQRPTPEERTWLLARLTDLAGEAGSERLVAGPLIADGEARGGVEAAAGDAAGARRLGTPLRVGLVGLALAAAVALGILPTGCDDGVDVSGSCEELLARWQTAVYQASIEPCGGDGDCVAVGEIEACECTLSGADAVPRGAYEDQGGPDDFIEIARRRCHDDCQPSTPPIIARCVANRCQLDHQGTCDAASSR